MPDTAILLHEPQTEAREGRSDKFRRLAAARVQRALDQLHLIGNLSAPAYTFSEGDAARVVAALRAGVDDVERRLAREKPRKLQFAFE